MKRNPQEIAKSRGGFLFVWIVNKPSTSDNSTLCASTAYVKNNLVNYLPLSGGKVTGQIRFNCGLINSTNDDAYKDIWFTAGDAWGQGGILTLTAKDSPHAAGSFQLGAPSDGGNTVYLLTGHPDGSLTWDSKNIVRSVNGVAADAAGNVDPHCLPLSGGTMTGGIYASPETFSISKVDYSGRIVVHGGTSYGSGASFYLNGKGYESGPGKGAFEILAHDGNNAVYFTGKPDGTLSWGGKEVERVYDLSDFLGDDGYQRNTCIRYESGIQVCFGNISVNGSSTLTYALPFKVVPSVTACPFVTNSYVNANVKLPTTTSVVIQLWKGSSVHTAAATTFFVAIGLWK